MGNRLSRIYTRTGDDGSTGLGDGTRVPKDHARIETWGALDELNSLLGVALALPLPPDVREALAPIQHELFDLGDELSIPGREVIDEAHVTRLERSLDALNALLPPLKEFVLPGGNQAAACLHLARAVCRRAERRATTLARDEKINPLALKYLNRLSHLLFVAARYLNACEQVPETLWQPGIRS